MPMPDQGRADGGATAHPYIEAQKDRAPRPEKALYRSCGTCKFMDNGSCRRLPPPWLGVSSTDWCGEYEQRPGTFRSEMEEPRWT